jgi:hypothetical protein
LAAGLFFGVWTMVIFIGGLLCEWAN